VALSTKYISPTRESPRRNSRVVARRRASSRETDATPRWNAIVSGDLYPFPARSTRSSCCNVPEKSVYPALAGKFPASDPITFCRLTIEFFNEPRRGFLFDPLTLGSRDIVSSVSRLEQGRVYGIDDTAALTD